MQLANELTSTEGLLDRLARFIPEHFWLRKCNRYVRINLATDKGADNDLFKLDDCCCGHSYHWHKERKLTLNNEQKLGKPEQWLLSRDTIKCQCDTYGQLLFMPGKGFDTSKILPGASAFYIRLAGGQNLALTYLEDVFRLMTSPSLWSLSSPQLILQVVGMSKKMQHLEADLSQRFTDGLIRAANTSKAWLITSGFHCGVSSLVGDAVNKHRMTHSNSDLICVGIGGWGVVNNREQLTNVDSSRDVGRVHGEVLSALASGAGMRRPHKHLRKYAVDSLGFCQRGTSLDPGHDCFLLIDNAKEKRYGEEIDFTAQFLDFVSRKTLRGAGYNAILTPSVLIVAGGECMTLITVELALSGQTSINDSLDMDREESRLENPISLYRSFPRQESLSEKSKMTSSSAPRKYQRPIVLLPKFGGASDILTFAYDITAPVADKDWKLYRSRPNFANVESRFPHDFDFQIRHHPAFDQLFQFIPEQFKAQEISNAIKRIRSCLRYRSLITVVDLTEEDSAPLDEAILNAILKSNTCSAAGMFEMAQLWGRGDIAKRLLCENDREIGQLVDMNQAMTNSVMRRQNDFFKLLVEYNFVDMSKYLTLYRLGTFYVDIFMKEKGKVGKPNCIQMFRSLILSKMPESMLQDDTNSETLENLGALLSSLLGCYMDNVITDEKSYMQMDELDYQVTITGDSCSSNSKTATPIAQSSPYPTSMRDFFILQLLLHNNDLAVYIWIKGRDHLGTALMANIFLKSLAKEATRQDMTDLASIYRDLSKDWLARAISLLTSCYDKNPFVCGRLITRSLLTWQGATLLELAYYGKVKKFMEQPAIQTTLTQIWLGRIATFTRQWMIYLTLFPPLFPFLAFRIRFVLKNPAKDLDPNGTDSDDPENNEQIELGQEASTIVKSKKQHDIRLARVSLFKHGRDDRLDIPTVIFLLYSSPIGKFFTHTISTIVFLFLFSTLILDIAWFNQISSLEVFIWLWCIVSFLDTVRSGFGKENLSVVERLQDFFRDLSVITQIIALFLVIAAALIRLFGPRIELHYIHTIYAVACVLYWLEAQRFLFVTESIGPKVHTLYRMFRDLAFFVVIFSASVVALSVPIYALTFPNHEINGIRGFFDRMFFICYDFSWNLFWITRDEDKLMVEGVCEIEEEVIGLGVKADSSNHTAKAHHSPRECPTENRFSMGLYWFYLLFANETLLDLMITMFYYTIDKSRLSATRIWRYNMYRFVHEYYNRPILPGLLMIPELVHRFLKFVRRQSQENSTPVDTDLKKMYSDLLDEDYRKLSMFERTNAEMLLAESSGELSIADVNEALGKRLQRAARKANNRLDRIESSIAKRISAGGLRFITK